MTDERENVFRYVAEQYGTKPEYLWEDDPVTAVLRHGDNRKWYGIVMSVTRKRLGLDGDGAVYVLNVKCDPVLNEPLRSRDGILSAYHMNKKHWLTALLDGSVEHETLYKLLDMSYSLTAARTKRVKQQKER